MAEQLQRLEEKRKNDESNLERMIAYGQTALCRWRTLLDYFEAEGMEADFRCGTCDRCREAPLKGVPYPNTAALPAAS